MIDIAAITAAIYARPAADAAGAAVRALLGDGAASVLHAEDLRVEGLHIAQLPARPLLALRRGAAPQADRVIWRPTFTWFIYDDIAQGYARTERVLAALGLAYYAAPVEAAGVRIGEVEAASLGAQLREAPLGLLYEALTLAVGAV